MLMLIVAGTSGCGGDIPEGLSPVEGFEVDRYLGKWYEIARLDHSFERGLDEVSAHYSLRDDGRIKVVNRGWNSARQEWRQAEGRARFRGASDVGALEVAFFGPFYGGYNILFLDPDYSYALVSGPSRKYLWILARDPSLDEEIVAKLVAQAGEWGFDTDSLIFPAHTGRAGAGDAEGF